MIKSALGKVAWVGRTASMVLGLALVMALVIGAASTAWSATGGSFLLGQKNVADAVSILVRKGPGPALSLVVEADQPPLRVNSSAKVPNLNADKLDGQDSSAFLGANATATDANLLDGKDSSAFVPTKTYVETQVFSTNGSGSITGNGPSCAQGDVLLSGGVKLQDAGAQEIVQSRPDPETPNAWFGSVKDDTGQGVGYEITLLCADLGTPYTR